MPSQLERAVAILNELKQEGKLRDFAIMGAYAYSHHAEAVSTADLDIVVLADSDAEYYAELGRAGERGEWRGMHVVLGGLPVQMFPTTIGQLYFDALLSSRLTEIGRQPAKVVTPEYLIVMFLVSFRLQDRLRIVRLLESVDRERVQELVAHHDADGTLRRRLEQLAGPYPGG
jgi:hypothetical protein